MKISISEQGEGKVYTYGFESTAVVTLDELVQFANRYSLSAPEYKRKHRAAVNIIEGGNFILIDCDELGQAEQVEEKLKQYDYVKVPSASNSEDKPYKWHYFIPTQKPLSIFPAAFKWQAEQFFRQVGIDDSMIDTSGSYDIARQFAPASIGMSPEEADELSEVHHGEMELLAPIQEAPEELCNSAAKSVTVKIKGIDTQELPTGHLWFKGKAITYADAITAVEEANKDGKTIVSSFGCPHDNHDHTGDRTTGYGFGFIGSDGQVYVKCTGNECKDHPNFFVPESTFIPSKFKKVTPINKPIPTDFYVNTMKEHWTKKLGQTVAVGMEYNWTMFADTMNRIIQENISGGASTAHVIGMATGESKTQGSIVYIALLNDHTDHNAMMVVNLNEDAFLVAEQINELGGDAIAYNSEAKNEKGKNLTPEEASTHRTVVISHETFKRHGHRESKKWKTLSRSRDLIIIDEALHDVEISIVNEYILDRIRPVADRLKDKDMLHIVNGFSSVLRDDLPSITSKGHTKVTSLQPQAISRNILEEFWGKEAANNVVDRDEVTKQLYAANNKTMTDFIKKIDNLPVTDATICKARGIMQTSLEHFYREQTKNSVRKLMTIRTSGTFATKSQGSLTAVKELLPGSISFAVMDATSSVNAIYQLQSTYRKNTRIVPVKKTRNYRGFKVNIIEMVTGQGSISGDDIHTLLDAVPLNPKDKVFIVTHKKLESYVESWIENNSTADITFDVEHFGNLTGKNTWRDFNKIVVIGLPHKNSQLYQALNIIKTDEKTAYSEDGKKNLTLIENTDLSADLVQAIARIRIRNVNDKNGGCLPAEAYITINPKLSMKSNLLHALETQFSGATFSDWTVPDIKKKQIKLPKGFESTLSYLDAHLTEIGNELDLYEPRDMLNIQRSTYTNLFKDKAFLERLQALGVEIQERPDYTSRNKRKKRPKKIFFKMRK